MKQILIVALVLVVAAVGAAAGYFAHQQFVAVPVLDSFSKGADVVAPKNNIQNQSGTDSTQKNAGQSVASVAPAAGNSADQNFSSRIEWIVPQQIENLKIFDDSQGFVPEETKYYKVGTFVGVYNGGDLILASALSDGPVSYPNYYRFASFEGKYILLTKYSEDDGSGLAAPDFSIDSSYSIPGLEFPKTISGSQPRQILKIQSGVNVFFDPANLKKVFTDKVLGDVYTTSGYPKAPASIFNRHGFYVKAPDGTVGIYALEPDFLAENYAPQITWNDGSRNEDDYSWTESSGCGSSNYASVISSEEINIGRDLKIAGKNSKGDLVYELDDKNHALLKNFYENGYSVYNGRKISYAEFTAAHPIFFWVDPFGRLIKFQGKQFQPAAECGKPVIYLYPEKTETVSVKIEPKGGLSYSDPAYGNGWRVKADPSGNLTEISSGKNYPYLFWEGTGAIYETPQKGFVIRREEVHDFLVAKLAKLGLNRKETADFIEFWEPRMVGAPYYFVTFLGNRQMDRIAPLSIEPKPDTVIRILMDFMPLKEPVAVEGYEIKTPARNGFTAVEWGGVIR